MTTAVLGTEAGPAAGGGAPPGHVRITSRALDRVVSAAAAEALGVSPRDVRATLADRRGELVLSVTGPVRLPALDRVSADPAVVDRYGGGLLERAEAARAVIRDRVGFLSGAVIGRIDLRFTSARTEAEGRVR